MPDNQLAEAETLSEVSQTSSDSSTRGGGGKAAVAFDHNLRIRLANVAFKHFFRGKAFVKGKESKSSTPNFRILKGADGVSFSQWHGAILGHIHDEQISLPYATTFGPVDAHSRPHRHARQQGRTGYFSVTFDVLFMREISRMKPSECDILTIMVFSSSRQSKKPAGLQVGTYIHVGNDEEESGEPSPKFDRRREATGKAMSEASLSL